jgi:GT2 family glycosyltransferase
VNSALDLVTTSKVIVANPDMTLDRAHWDALATGTPDEVRTVPQQDAAGTPNSIVNRYPTPSTLLLTGYRASRVLGGRGTRRRRMLTSALGRWGREHEALQHDAVGAWPLREYWFSGAAFSVATDRLRSVGGFDERYFLYLEDVDLSRRLANRYPEMTVRVVDVEPAVHTVGGSVGSTEARHSVDLHYARSAVRYADGQPGLAWSLCRAALRARCAWLARSTQ